jgi:acyl dehydratase
VTATARAESLAWTDLAVGDELPVFELSLTATMIVAGAIASRDFMPAHHDRDFAVGQGSRDIFMNILTTNGYVARYLTDWAGPEAWVKRIAIRLGAPAHPGDALRFSGSIVRLEEQGGEGEIEVELRAANSLGDHAKGTAVLTLPLDAAASRRR